mmetsp:Transcript_7137/g.14870  ORF Transcript_7137/g.14870 Transcript_7137/m.14870 type:complete len:98 (-) Transcript_7137:68-361(-)
MIFTSGSLFSSVAVCNTSKGSLDTRENVLRLFTVYIIYKEKNNDVQIRQPPITSAACTKDGDLILLYPRLWRLKTRADYLYNLNGVNEKLMNINDHQ